MLSKNIIEQEHTEALLHCLGVKSYELSFNVEPEPDFTLSTADLNIGIEHTRLHLPKDMKGVDLTAHTKVAERVMEQAQRMFEDNNSELLTVTVYFRNSYGTGIKTQALAAKDVKTLSEFIYKFVASHIPLYGECLRFNRLDFATKSIILPPEILYISILNKFRCWSHVKGGAVPRIQGEALSHRVDEKNSKVRNYRGTYDEIWLLLVESQNAIYTYFDFDDIEKISCSSYFNKTYILRHPLNKVYLLENDMSMENIWSANRLDKLR